MKNFIFRKSYLIKLYNIIIKLNFIFLLFFIKFCFNKNLILKFFYNY